MEIETTVAEVRSRLRRQQCAYTVVELTVVLAVAAILAAIAVPGLAWTHGRAAVGADARELALVLRRAQARAAAGGQAVRVRLVDGGVGYVCEQDRGGSWSTVAQGSFEGLMCATNYPGAAVSFDPAGWPMAVGAGPRAGNFTFSCHGATSTVVLQLGGRIRWA